MTDSTPEGQESLADPKHKENVDPGAAPGVSDAGSVGRTMGTGRAGAGTGTSIGPSRGNTGPGTGSDKIEREYGQDPPTRLTEMVGAGSEREDGGEGGNGPVGDPARTGAAGQSASVRPDTPGATPDMSDTRGLGDNDIPAETDVR
ncbi:MAG: hypothetical protein ACR2M0_16135 [Chloroflexia bacterium]